MHIRRNVRLTTRSGANDQKAAVVPLKYSGSTSPVEITKKPQNSIQNKILHTPTSYLMSDMFGLQQETVAQLTLRSCAQNFEDIEE